MTTPQRVLEIAASRIGYYAPNDPLPGSEAGRYVADLWARYSSLADARADGCYNWEGGASWLRGPSKSIWWCCLFVSMCYHMAGGRNMPGIPNYNCDNLKSKVRSANVPGAFILGNKRDAQPGDFVLFDWGGDGSCDHIGIVELNCGGYIQTIEGNTSGSNGGSQSSGNGVWRRTRNWSTVNCIIRPIYTGDEPAPEPIPEPIELEKLMSMDCVIQPNGIGRLDVLIGGQLHTAADPDEVEAARMVYRDCNDGEEMPSIALGEEGSPWASRFYDLLARPVDRSNVPVMIGQ